MEYQGVILPFPSPAFGTMRKGERYTFASYFIATEK